MVVFRCKRQTDASKSVERESGAGVELFEDARELRGGWDELSASAWHRGCPVVVVVSVVLKTGLGGCLAVLNSEGVACLFGMYIPTDSTCLAPS